MKTLSDFTPEIQAKIPQYHEKYLKGVFDGGKYNNFKIENATALINFNYEKCGYKKPVIIVAENPFEAQAFFNYINSNKEQFLLILYINYCLLNGIELPKEISNIKIENSQLNSQLHSQLYSQLDSQLHSQLNSQLYSQLNSQLYSQLNSQLDSQLNSQLYSQLYSQLNSQLYSQLYSQLDSQLHSQLNSQLDSQLYSQLNSQLHSQLDSQLNSQLDSQLYSQLYSQLHSQLNSQLYSQLYSQLDSQLHSQLYSQLEQKYNEDYLYTIGIYGGSYFAFYKFIKDEFNLSAETNVNLDSFENLHQNGNIYSAVFSELVCVISKYPKMIHRNEKNDLHSISVSCIEWSNSTDLTKWNNYFINGRNIPEKYFNSISDKTFKIEDFINETNEEYKSTCIAFMQEKYGDEYLVNFFRKYLTEVDSFTDKKDSQYLTGTTGGMNIGVYTLFKGNINGEDIAYVRCYCPSSDRMFFLGVDSVYTTAKNAIASLYRISTKLKTHIKSISRQGERFSTILTEKGKGILETLSKEEIENLSTLSGSDYFTLIKYEF
jgi:hypothetical protein